MNPVCPNYLAPKLYHNAALDEDFEGSAMCSLRDTVCGVEYGEECETYKEYLKEVEDVETKGLE